MKTRYTIKDLRTDVATANRALLDADKPGCYFYTIGQSYGRTQLYSSRIDPDGRVIQYSQLESGTPRECLSRLYRSDLAGYCHPHKRINRHQAAGMLAACSDIMEHDSNFTASPSDMGTVVNMAKACNYRKPSNAPGSLGRMFWESAQRATKKSPWSR